MADMEQRKATNKKILKWFAISLGALVVIAMLGKLMQKDDSAERAKVEAENIASLKAARAEEQAKVARHDSLMQYSKPYRDSVKAAEAEIARREEEEAKRNSPEKYIDIDMGWRKGGFGSVALADITIANNSLVDMKDPVIMVTFYGESDTEIGSKVETLLIKVPAGKKASQYKVNLGFIKGQAAKARATFVSATWSK
jgi:hypothetical protein